MKEKKQNNQPQEKKTILIVDDDARICECFSVFLAKHGYLSISAHGGKEGWNIFKSKKPNLVITDMVMPDFCNKISDKAGLELIARIRKEYPQIPIIGISGYNFSIKAIKLGAIEVLIKPILPGTLTTTVEDILSKSELERELLRYKNLADVLSKKNEILEERLYGSSKSKAVGMPENEPKRYNVVCSEVAHNLKNEFMHIGHSLNEIRENVGTFPEIVEECNMIERSLAYSRLLMQRLLNFLEMGSLQREPIELKALIQKIEALAGPRLAFNIRLQTYIPSRLDKIRISGNFEQLMAIFLEFINNASRILRPTGGNIEIEVAEKDDRALIFIKDNGPGIPGELRNKIVKEQVHSKNGGLGIGLFLAGKVIKEFNGDLKVETEDGKGTTFTISFPTLRDKKEL